jgi:hypothetical protein
MKQLYLLYCLIAERHLALPALLFAINLGCAVAAFVAGDRKRGVYWLASGICIAMVSL